VNPLFIALSLSLLAIAPYSTAAVGNRDELYDEVNAAALRIEQQAAADLNDFKTPEGRERRHAEALEMFGLSPMPERGDLHATITGRVEDDTVAVEKIHFQSSPGLYVTANFYLPKHIDAPLPTVLYVCGHAEVKTNGVSYGNKTAYQHHGAWFARNGYACLVIDTCNWAKFPACITAPIAKACGGGIPAVIRRPVWRRGIAFARPTIWKHVKSN
jgi:hypothetical protein